MKRPLDTNLPRLHCENCKDRNPISCEYATERKQFGVCPHEARIVREHLLK